MSWKAIHPDSTMDVRVPDEDGAPVFTIGYWPPREAARLLRQWKQIADGKTDDPELGFATAYDMVRFSVRGWTGFDGIKPTTEALTIDRREHMVLSGDAMHAVFANRLLLELKDKALLFNVLSEDQKKTSGLRWESPTSKTLTDAPTAAVTAPSPAARTSSPESTASSSPGVPGA